MKLTPQGNRIVVELLPLIPDSKIIIPDSVEAKDSGKWIVREVGPGRILNNGQVIPIPLQPGDEIIADPRSGYTSALVPAWQFENRKFAVIEYEGVICKIDRTNAELEQMKKKMLQPRVSGANGVPQL